MYSRSSFAPSHAHSQLPDWGSSREGSPSGVIPSGELPQRSEAGCGVPGASREVLGEASGAHNHQAHDQSCSLHLHTAGTSRIVQTHCGCPPVLVTSYGASGSSCPDFISSCGFSTRNHLQSFITHQEDLTHYLPSTHFTTLWPVVFWQLVLHPNLWNPLTSAGTDGAFMMYPLCEKALLDYHQRNIFFHCVTLFKFLSSPFFSLPASYTLQNMKYLPNITQMSFLSNSLTLQNRLFTTVLPFCLTGTLGECCWL